MDVEKGGMACPEMTQKMVVEERAGSFEATLASYFRARQSMRWTVYTPGRSVCFLAMCILRTTASAGLTCHLTLRPYSFCEAEHFEPVDMLYTINDKAA